MFTPWTGGGGGGEYALSSNVTELRDLGLQLPPPGEAALLSAIERSPCGLTALPWLER